MQNNGNELACSRADFYDFLLIIAGQHSFIEANVASEGTKIANISLPVQQVDDGKGV